MTRIRRSDLALQMPETVTVALPGLVAGGELAEVDVRPLTLSQKLRFAAFEPIKRADGQVDADHPGNDLVNRVLAWTVVDADGSQLMPAEQWSVWGAAQSIETVSNLVSLALTAAGMGGGAEKK